MCANSKITHLPSRRQRRILFAQSFADCALTQSLDRVACADRLWILVKETSWGYHSEAGATASRL
jgi:hypothetical protein